MDCCGVDNESGGGRTRQIYFDCAQLLRVTKFGAVPSNRSSQQCCRPFLPVTNLSERQISPATRTDRSIEV